MPASFSFLGTQHSATLASHRIKSSYKLLIIVTPLIFAIKKYVALFGFPLGGRKTQACTHTHRHTYTPWTHVLRAWPNGA